LQTPQGTALQCILAVPARRYSGQGELCERLEAQRRSDPATAANRESLRESKDAEGRRVVVAHDPARAELQRGQRDARIAAVDALAGRLAARFDALGSGQPKRGRRAGDEGAFAQVRAAVQGAGLSRIHTDVDGGRFLDLVDDGALARARLFVGKLIPVTKVRDLSAEAIVERYKGLADIELAKTDRDGQSRRCKAGSGTLSHRYGSQCAGQSEEPLH
jgi:hypothetical protein